MDSFREDNLLMRTFEDPIQIDDSLQYADR